MLSTQQAAEAAAAWAGDVLGIDEASQSAYPQAGKTAALPDVVAVVQHRSQREGPDEHYFPFAELQQTWMVLFVIELSVMVELGGDDEADAKAAHEYLETVADSLAEAIFIDGLLGGRLSSPQMASPTFAVDLADPFVEYADGTKGRAFFATMAIAELRDEPTL